MLISEPRPVKEQRAGVSLCIVYYVMTIILHVKMSIVMNCITLCQTKKVIEVGHKGNKKNHLRTTKEKENVTFQYDSCSEFSQPY